MKSDATKVLPALTVDRHRTEYAEKASPPDSEPLCEHEELTSFFPAH